MIYLTHTGEEKEKFLLNERNILNVESSVSGTSNVYMQNGKVFTVVETKEEIEKKVQEYEVSIIRQAIELVKKV